MDDGIAPATGERNGMNQNGLTPYDPSDSPKAGKLQCACGFTTSVPAYFASHLSTDNITCEPAHSYTDMGLAELRKLNKAIETHHKSITFCETEIAAWEKIMERAGAAYRESLRQQAIAKQGGRCVKCRENTKSQWLGKWQCASHTIVKVGRNAVKPDDARFKTKDGKECQSVSDILAGVLADL